MTARVLEPAAVAGIDPAATMWRLDGAALDALAAHLETDRQTVERLVMVGAHAAGVEIDPFELRAGDWYLDLPRATARAVLSGTVLTSALTALHEASLPAAVLSVVVPLLFDVDRVRLSASDRYVYAVLRRRPSDRKSIDDWYAELPEPVRDEVGPIEFRDLIERLENAQLVELDVFDQLGLKEISDRRLIKLDLPPPDA